MKHYEVAITVSGDQGPVMRRVAKMPLAMLDVISEALAIPEHYCAVAEALAIGPVTVPTVCFETSMKPDKARQVLRAAGAQVLYRGRDGVAFWGLPETE